MDEWVLDTPNIVVCALCGTLQCYKLRIYLDLFSENLFGGSSTFTHLHLRKHIFLEMYFFVFDTFEMA